MVLLLAKKWSAKVVRATIRVFYRQTASDVAQSWLGGVVIIKTKSWILPLKLNLKNSPESCVFKSWIKCRVQWQNVDWRLLLIDIHLKLVGYLLNKKRQTCKILPSESNCWMPLLKTGTRFCLALFACSTTCGSWVLISLNFALNCPRNAILCCSN